MDLGGARRLNGMELAQRGGRRIRVRGHELTKLNSHGLVPGHIIVPTDSQLGTNATETEHRNQDRK